MASHLDEDPCTDDSKERCLEDDARLFLQIRNSINGKYLISLITVNLLRS